MFSRGAYAGDAVVTKSKLLIAGFAVALSATANGGSESLRIIPGAYEVDVRLELPFVEAAGAAKSAVVCLTEGASDGTHGLVVLSENNPLGACATSNAVEGAETISFRIACPGVNAAQADAAFTFAGDTFEGRIKMKMGGKNMTMSEWQRGRRIGDCERDHP